MKSLTQFINEFSRLDFSAFNIARASMPQIVDIKDFTNFLSSLGVEYVTTFDYLDGYNPTQTDLDEYKVKLIQMKFRKEPDSIPDLPPVIVSEDGFVLDGHHRYYAAINTVTQVPYIKVYLPINKLLKLCMDYQELRNG